MQHALLIGNGINNIKDQQSWIGLLEKIIQHIEVIDEIRIENKPFPLLYEEIYGHALKKGFSELAIKSFIADEISQIKPNIIHEEILKLGIQNILTTNYDFTFEKLQSEAENGFINNGIIKETTYNIFRHYDFNDHLFWHIHGDTNNPITITLGYEHYSGYLQYMRNYVVNGTGTTYKRKLESLIRRFQEDQYEIYSWIDFFFKSNIYIIGLTLDFIEIHLWWLLTYRQRQKQSISSKTKINISNKIFYYYPAHLADNILQKLELLKALDVVPVAVTDPEIGETFYIRVLNLVKQNMQAD